MPIWCNLVILAQIHYKLSWRQAKFPRILSQNGQNGQNDLEGQCKWPPCSIPSESIPGCMFDANLVILAQIYDESSRGQAEFPRILSQNGQNDLEGQCQWPPFSIPIESIPGCMFCAKLVILAQIYEELSRGKPNFLEFEVKMAKWNWRSRSMTSIFNTGREYPKMHVWCKYSDSRSNLWWVIVRTR